LAPLFGFKITFFHCFTDGLFATIKFAIRSTISNARESNTQKVVMIMLI